MAIKQQSTYQKYLLDIVALYQTRPDIKAYLELLLSIFTIILFAIFAIRPTLVTVGQLLTQINEKKATLASLTKKADDLATAQNILQKDAASLSLLDLAIPQKSDPTGFIRQIEGIAKKDSVTITSSKLGETPLLEPKKETSITANFEVSIAAESTNFENLKNFTADLENLLRPISPENVTQTTTKVDQQTFTLSYVGLISYLTP